MRSKTKLFPVRDLTDCWLNNGDVEAGMLPVRPKKYSTGQVGFWGVSAFALVTTWFSFPF